MLCVILAALAVTTILSAVFIRRTESQKSDKLLQMLCVSGQRSLDYYFDSVQNAVTKVTSFAEEDLDSVDSEEQLTAAAEQVERGNYDLDLAYDDDDELGRLTRSFKNLSDTVKEHISDLHGQVFLDALTKVKNKGALSNYLSEIQKCIDSETEERAFAVGVFDCDNLKLINDRYGHDKGDIYLKKAAHTICEVFKHSPVFRMGGDEFAVILENEDYMNRDALLEQFDMTAEKINEAAAEPWEQANLSKGVAVFEPSEDSAVTDVMKRADQLMYENKRERKKRLQ